MEVEGRFLDDDGSVSSPESTVDACADGLSIVASAADSSIVATAAYGPVPDRGAGRICSCCKVEDLVDDDDDGDEDTVDEKKEVRGSTMVCLRVEDAAVAMPCVRACIFCKLDWILSLSNCIRRISILFISVFCVTYSYVLCHCTDVGEL